MSVRAFLALLLRCHPPALARRCIGIGSPEEPRASLLPLTTAATAEKNVRTYRLADASGGSNFPDVRLKVFRNSHPWTQFLDMNEAFARNVGLITPWIISSRLVSEEEADQGLCPELDARAWHIEPFEDDGAPSGVTGHEMRDVLLGFNTAGKKFADIPEEDLRAIFRELVVPGRRSDPEQNKDPEGGAGAKASDYGVANLYDLLASAVENGSVSVRKVFEILACEKKSSITGVGMNAKDGLEFDAVVVLERGAYDLPCPHANLLPAGQEIDRMTRGSCRRDHEDPGRTIIPRVEMTMFSKPGANFFEPDRDFEGIFEHRYISRVWATELLDGLLSDGSPRRDAPFLKDRSILLHCAGLLARDAHSFFARPIKKMFHRMKARPDWFRRDVGLGKFESTEAFRQYCERVLLVEE